MIRARGRGSTGPADGWDTQDHEHGTPATRTPRPRARARTGTRIRDVLRSLPWGSLVLADLLTTVIIVAGLVALVIPGLAAITLLAVVGPVIEIEHRHAVAGLRRSAHLVRPLSGGSRRSATLPLLLSSGIVAILPDPSGHRRRGDHPDRPVDREGDPRLGGRPAAGGAATASSPPTAPRPAWRPGRSPAADPAAGLPDMLPQGAPGRPGLMVAPGQGRLDRGRPRQGASVAANRLPGACACDPFRVRGRVHVEKLRTCRTRRPASRSRSSWTRPV